MGALAESASLPITGLRHFLILAGRMVNRPRYLPNSRRLRASGSSSMEGWGRAGRSAASRAVHFPDIPGRRDRLFLMKKLKKISPFHLGEGVAEDTTCCGALWGDAAIWCSRRGSNKLRRKCFHQSDFDGGEGP